MFVLCEKDPRAYLYSLNSGQRGYKYVVVIFLRGVIIHAALQAVFLEGVELSSSWLSIDIARVHPAIDVS